MKCFLQLSAILGAFILSACGTVQTYEEENGIKRIEYHTVGAAFPSRAALYATKEAQMDMNVTAAKECPNGFEKLKEQYVPEKDGHEDKLVWYVKCLEVEK